MDSYIVIGCGSEAEVVANLLPAAREHIFFLNAVEGNETCVNPRLSPQFRGHAFDEKTWKAVFLSGHNIEVVRGVGDNEMWFRWVLWMNRQFAFTMASVVHYSITSEIELKGCGCVLHHGVHIGINVTLGMGSIINTKAIIEHDCKIAPHCFIGPGVVLCGNVEVGPLSYIGAGAVVRPGVSIGPNCFVEMGSVVTRDMEEGSRWLHASLLEKPIRYQPRSSTHTSEESGSFSETALP